MSCYYVYKLRVTNRAKRARLQIVADMLCRLALFLLLSWCFLSLLSVGALLLTVSL